MPSDGRDAATEQDRHLYDGEHVDEASGEEAADDCGFATDAYVEVAAASRARASAPRGASTKWNTVSPALRLDRRVVREHEERRVWRRRMLVDAHRASLSPTIERQKRVANIVVQAFPVGPNERRT